MSRRLLQATTALLGLATLALGGMSLALGARSPVYAGSAVPELPALDSNLRFFGGLGIGLGALLLWMVPTIERRTVLFRAVWICAFIGGLGRVWSMFAVGLPPLPMTVFTAIEVPLVPLLLVWQAAVARRAPQSRK